MAALTRRGAAPPAGPSSRRTGPSSGGSVVSSSSMATARQEREARLAGLVGQFISAAEGFPPGSQNFTLSLEYMVGNLLHHSYKDLVPQEAYEKYTRVCDKIEFNGLYNKADRLRQLAAQLAARPTPHLAATQVHSNFMVLMLELANQPTHGVDIPERSGDAPAAPLEAALDEEHEPSDHEYADFDDDLQGWQQSLQQSDDDNDADWEDQDTTLAKLQSTIKKPHAPRGVTLDDVPVGLAAAAHMPDLLEDLAMRHPLAFVHQFDWSDMQPGVEDPSAKPFVLTAHNQLAPVLYDESDPSCLAACVASNAVPLGLNCTLLVAPETVFVMSVLHGMLGYPSHVFNLRDGVIHLVIPDDGSFAIADRSPRVLSSQLQWFVPLMNDLHALDAVSQYMLTGMEHALGPVVEAFAAALRTFMTNVQRQCMGVLRSAVAPDGTSAVQHQSVSLLSLQRWSASLASVVSKLCAIAKRVLQRGQGEEPRQRAAVLLSSLHDEVSKATTLRNLPTISGISSQAVGSDVLHNVALDPLDSLASIFVATLTPYMQHLSLWLHEGQVNDPIGEFSVALNATLVGTQAQPTAGEEFTLARKSLPSFLREVGEHILNCGRTVCIMRNLMPAARAATMAAADLMDMSVSLETLAERLVAQEAAPPPLSAPAIAQEWLQLVAQQIDRMYKDDTLPFKAVVERCILERIREHSVQASLALKHVFVDKLDVLRHLHAMRLLFFMEQGDILSGFCNDLFPLIGVEEDWQDSIRLTASARASIAAIGPAAELLDPDRVHFSVVDGITKRGCSALNTLNVAYEVEWPLTLLITPAVVQQYSSIFRLLLQAKWCKFDLDALHKDLRHRLFDIDKQLRQCGRPSVHIRQQLHQMQLWVAAFMHFVNNLQAYFMNQVTFQWADFEAKVRAASSLEQIIAIHTAVLDRLMRQCLLTKPLVVLEEVLAVLDTVLESVVLCRQLVDQSETCAAALAEEFPADAERQGVASDAKSHEVALSHTYQDLQSKHDRFTRSVRLLILVAETRVASGVAPYLTDVLVRMDFTGYYSTRPDGIK